ncbi:MAG TPA: hypothetical protein VJU18_02645 [Vicinamibacteria bacterium]|nr:hypothetical protein [Vicinamibacteria bacterium]
MRSSATLRAGDWVEVRSAEEIRRTLDGNAQLEGMPFMPEMLPFCGKRFKVEKRAHKTCDTVDYIGGRRLFNTVHLEGLRCDGSAHAGCNALCLLFWKEAWLRKLDGAGEATAHPATAEVPVLSRSGLPEPGSGCTEEDVWRGTRAPGEPHDAPDPTYVCQATRLLEATIPLRRSDLGQYVEDFASGNVTLLRILGDLLFVGYSTIIGGRYGLGTPLRWSYDTVQRLLDGTPYPDRRGKIPAGGKTPSRRLDLQAGELVRVRTLPEILETTDENLRNRGMGFHQEMVPFTGKTYRVLRRIEKIVHEKTGKLILLKNDAVILDEVVCQGRHINNCRRFCPRAVYLYFREIWLERVEASPAQSVPAGAGERPPPQGAMQGDSRS